MGNNILRERLKKAVEILLVEENDYFLMTQAINEMHDIYSSISGFSSRVNDSIEVNETLTSNGKAIAPVYAGRCLFDIMRTKQFIRGIYHAVIESKRIFNGTKINILYAGCGPYASLVIPLCMIFSKDEISFTLLDIHEESINCAEKIINGLDINDYLNGSYVCDAAQYVNDKNKPFHILVSETMQMALANEPQVAIFLNLVPQMVENGFIIPEKVTLDAYMFLERKETERLFDVNVKTNRVFISRLFELSKNTVDKKETDFPEVEIDIPGQYIKTHKLYLMTEITVFKNVVLKDNESSLTIPFKLFRNKNIPEHAAFRYETGSKPGLKYSYQ
jgi:hypothetical protein